MTGDRFSRNEALFGASGQAAIASTKVAVIGCGGLGSHLVQQLAYLGTEDFGLIDDDLVSESSLNRLVGAGPDDVGRAKVEVAVRSIAFIRPDASARAVRARVGDDEARVVIEAADVVFAGLDNDLARLELTELCAYARKPYFDLASDTGDDRGDIWFGGRVVFCDGTRCLSCLGLLDHEEIGRMRLDPEQREARDRSYGVSRDSLNGTGPAVVSVNATVAALAVTEYMVWRTRLRDPAAHVNYYGERRTVRLTVDTPADGCPYCEGLWGRAPRCD